MRIKILDNNAVVKDLLKELAEISEIGRCGSIEWFSAPEDFLESYVPESDNLIFIKLGGQFNGLDVAERLRSVDQYARLVFFSGSQAYALDSFQYHPVAYLIEPIEARRLREAITNSGKGRRAMSSCWGTGK